MRTISFYSYKGGTGRTLLVANLAVYAARLGQTVAMVDLDLEVPGLAYKFLPSPHPNLVSWNGFQEIRDHTSPTWLTNSRCLTRSTPAAIYG